MKKNFFLAACFGLLWACATAPDSSNIVKSSNSKTSLSPVTLAPNACGLFVWTGNKARHFILFSDDKGQTGTWLSQATEHAISIVSSSGVKAYGQSPQTVYKTDSGQEVSLTLEKREPIEGGTRFKAGTLSYLSDDGWERIIPVVALAACQSS